MIKQMLETILEVRLILCDTGGKKLTEYSTFQKF